MASVTFQIGLWLIRSSINPVDSGYIVSIFPLLRLGGFVGKQRAKKTSTGLRHLKKKLDDSLKNFYQPIRKTRRRISPMDSIDFSEDTGAPPELQMPSWEEE